MFELHVALPQFGVVSGIKGRRHGAGVNCPKGALVHTPVNRGDEDADMPWEWWYPPPPILWLNFYQVAGSFFRAAGRHTCPAASMFPLSPFVLGTM